MNEEKKGILEQLHAIEELRIVYNIIYRKAGIAFMFFVPFRITDYDESKHLSKQSEEVQKAWKEGLHVIEYYPTFEDAVRGEYARLFTETGGGA